MASVAEEGVLFEKSPLNDARGRRVFVLWLVDLGCSCKMGCEKGKQEGKSFFCLVGGLLSSRIEGVRQVSRNEDVLQKVQKAVEREREMEISYGGGGIPSGP